MTPSFFFMSGASHRKKIWRYCSNYSALSPHADNATIGSSSPGMAFGIAPLEAMVSGLPLVAPNCGGVASYANSENAWVVRPDVQSFATAIEELLTNDSERIARVQNALRTAEQYRWEKVAPSFLDLYSELHLAFTTESTSLPAPAFSSTQADGLQLALSRGVSQIAERTFRLASTLFPRS
jgi:hypothetical protein